MKERLNKIRSAMSERGLDAALIVDEMNAYYFSGLQFSDGCLFICHDAAYLITDFRYVEVAEREADSAFTVSAPKSHRDYISEIILKHGIRTVGIEGGAMPYRDYNSFVESHPGVLLYDLGSIIDELRSIKSDLEIEYIKKAQSITDKAFSHLLSVIRTDMTEIEVAAELEYTMRRIGADGPAFETIAVSGDASSMPHGVPRNIKLKRGFLTLDYGARYKGYCSDMTRTLCVGRASKEEVTLYNTVLSAQRAALDFLRAGADAAEADSKARTIIDSYDAFRGTFGHSLGHSVGLYVHESPSLSPRATGKLLEQGNVVTVEPGIYLKGKYGCRIEDMVKIEANGIYNFTNSPKELVEIL